MAAATLPLACAGRSPAAPSPSPAIPPAATGGAPPAADTPGIPWDLEGRGVPRFIPHQYIDITNIARVSRFRSGEGHDYSDDVERCRSMKHYFVPRFASMDSSTIPVYAPVTGEVVRLLQEWAGVQIEIKSAEYPAFRVILFHVNPSGGVAVGASVAAGQRIGAHIGNQTASDVAIAVESTAGRRYVSWFDGITDDLFGAYAGRGVVSRSAAIISRGERDANPLSCSGEVFSGPGTLANWVELR